MGAVVTKLVQIRHTLTFPTGIHARTQYRQTPHYRTHKHRQARTHSPPMHSLSPSDSWQTVSGTVTLVPGSNRSWDVGVVNGIPFEPMPKAGNIPDCHADQVAKGREEAGLRTGAPDTCTLLTGPRVGLKA